ncbi:hypothetical protein [Komagataeibacter melaceti]|uniref:hypothetical protein n=1 Tax=Komagataeibacter melaceti TaxID=2766577 RepID=UPI0011E599B4|nr:hypothetical protein [Komagataeibacter melaceti]
MATFFYVIDEIAKIAVPGVIAGAAFSVAHSQREIAANKYYLDLHNLRLKTVEDMQRLVEQATENDLYDVETHSALCDYIQGCRYLFNCAALNNYSSTIRQWRALKKSASAKKRQCNTIAKEHLQGVNLLSEHPPNNLTEIQRVNWHKFHKLWNECMEAQTQAKENAKKASNEVKSLTVDLRKSIRLPTSAYTPNWYDHSIAWMKNFFKRK